MKQNQFTKSGLYLHTLFVHDHRLNRMSGIFKAFIIRCFGVVIIIVILISAFPWNVSAASTDIYGDLSTYYDYNRQNDNSLATPYGYNDLNSVGDLYLHTITSDQVQFFLDLKLTGCYIDSPFIQAPMDLTVNQLYLMTPVYQDKAFLYWGEKYKEIGVSYFFNISNRISPKYLNGFNYTWNPVYLTELDVLSSDTLSYGYIRSFEGPNNLSDVLNTEFVDTRLGNLNLEGYLYEDSANQCLGLDATYQINKYQLYLESIVKQKAEQKIITGNTGDPAVDFQPRDLNGALDFVVGYSVSNGNFSAAVEYMYRNEGYDAGEQDAFIDYLKDHPAAAALMDESDFSSDAFSKNYLGINISQAAFLVNDLSLNLAMVVSGQTDVAAYWKYMGYKMVCSLAYSLTQNLKLTINQACFFGGESSEYRLEPDNYICSFEMDYSF